jgi:anti-sigma factor RsiW
MKGKISARDYELLSAYLDKQLSARERARLETRLRTTPELHSALEDLHKTHLLLRSLPRPRRPRSFVLRRR